MNSKVIVLSGGDSLIQRLSVSKDDKEFSMVLYAKPSHLLTDFEWGACQSLIGAGGAVNRETAIEELSKSEHTAIAKIDGIIVATGSIKRVRKDYAAQISRKSGFPFPADANELGYVSVNKAYQGKNIGHIIVGHLLFAARQPRVFVNGKQASPKVLFATTSSEGMKTILRDTGFDQVGKEWIAVRGHKLSLWLANKAEP